MHCDHQICARKELHLFAKGWVFQCDNFGLESHGLEDIFFQHLNVGDSSCFFPIHHHNCGISWFCGSRSGFGSDPTLLPGELAKIRKQLITMVIIAVIVGTFVAESQDPGMVANDGIGMWEKIRREGSLSESVGNPILCY